MDDSKWERFGLAGGVLFVVLIVVGTLIGGITPKPTDSAAKIAHYFTQHQTALKFGAYLSGAAAVPFLWFAGTLWSRLRKAEGGAGRVSMIALAGGVATVALGLIGYAITAFITQYAGDLGPSGAKGFYLLAESFFGISAFAIAVFVAATSVVILRSGMLAKQLGWAGGALVMAWLVAGAGVADNSTWLNTVGLVVFLVWLAWILVLSGLLVMGSEPAAST